MVQDPQQRVNLRELRPGQRIALAGGIIAEIIENPEDGMWLRGRYISFPGQEALVGTEDQIFAADVRGLAAE